MKRNRRATAEKLLHDVSWAMANGFGPRELIPMLERLLAQAPSGSAAALFGARELAERIVSRHPWRAALLSRAVLQHQDDERAWAVRGLALSMLGHYRAAVRAYLRALALAPAVAVYAHNLGHLLDVALDRPRQALYYLAAAHRSEPADVEIAASYAHALLRAGQGEQAERILAEVLPGGRRAGQALIERWSAGR